MKGVFLDCRSVDNDDMDFSSIETSLSTWEFYSATPDSKVSERICDADVLVTNKVLISREDMAQAKKLRLICIAATGTNNIDLEAAKENKIIVSNVRDYATASVTQHVFALILSLIVKLPEYKQAIVSGAWHNNAHFSLLDYPIMELAGKTMGIIGYGVLGKSVAQIAKCFGMKVVVAARPKVQYRKGEVDRLPMTELLEISDVISLHCPLTESTKNLIDRNELAMMKQSAIIINTARGGIINEEALATALKNDQIGGAGVDVLTVEPPVNSNPLLEMESANLIVTPHIAWASVESRQRLLNLVAGNINAFVAGTPMNVVG